MQRQADDLASTLGHLNTDELEKVRLFALNLLYDRRRHVIDKLLRILHKENQEGFSQVRALIHSWNKRDISQLTGAELNKVYWLIKNMQRQFSFAGLPFDVVLRIMEHGDWDSLARLCSTDKGMADWCRENRLWAEVFRRKYGFHVPEWVTDDQAGLAAITFMESVNARRNRDFIMYLNNDPKRQMRWSSGGETYHGPGSSGWFQLAYVTSSDDLKAAYKSVFSNFFQDEGYDEDYDEIEEDDITFTISEWSNEPDEDDDDQVPLVEAFKLFYDLWKKAGYRWSTPVPQSELHSFVGESGEEYFNDQGQEVDEAGNIVERPVYTESDEDEMDYSE